MVILTIKYFALVLVELTHKRLGLLYAVAMGVKAEAVILSGAFGEVLPRLARETEATTIILGSSTGGSSRYEGAELERFLDAPKEE
jgi:nucleotide-binding universal stress UspA family protein